ncbi:type II secretion system secretin GspD [Parahaliea aestuarii]|uniref:type II secretion system secretin GspD n=1 Tax=Parahaliea aestuarii TaxID=1852021 RepID=UPI00164FB2B8|nr:type II secretion system secretin GspD [Parahaliea aestuarii]
MNTFFSIKQRYTFLFIVLFLQSIPAPHAQEATAGEKITLSLENADIKHLIQWASAYIDKTIIVHPAVQGKVTVIAGEPIPAVQVGSIFQSVLQVYGFIAVESDDTIKVLPETLSSSSTSAIAEGNQNAGKEQVVTKVIPIEHQSADALAGRLKPFLSNGATVVVFPESNSLLVADRAQVVNRLEEIIDRIDRDNSTNVSVIRLQHSKATDIVSRLQEVLPKKADNAQGKLLYTADDRSNSILVSGDEESVKPVIGLINRLDTPNTYSANTQVVFLEYADAQSIAESLKAISEGIRSRDMQAGKPDIAVIIEVNEEHNALIITATPTVIDEMRQVILQLDQRRMQVVVEALIVEVNEEDAKDLGVEWRALLDIEGGFAGNSTLTKNLPVPDLPGLGPGLSLGFLRADETGLLIRALETSGAANILSKPTIVSLDNEEATILVGSNVPFITGSSTSSASPTSNPFQTITRQDIGITLAIKPQINMNRSITLEIEQKVESLSDSVTSTADVVTNKREIQTKVLIEHDQILVLGGLMRDELQESGQGVPLLSDIPLLGRLFQGKATQVRKNNLMVFIRPTILASSDEGARLTKQQFNQISQDQSYINEKIDTFLVPHEPPHIGEDAYWDNSTQGPEASDESSAVNQGSVQPDVGAQ